MELNRFSGAIRHEGMALRGLVEKALHFEKEISSERRKRQRKPESTRWDMEEKTKLKRKRAADTEKSARIQSVKETEGTKVYGEGGQLDVCFQVGKEDQGICDTV